MKTANDHLKDMIGNLLFENATLKADKEELGRQLVAALRMLPAESHRQFAQQFGVAPPPAQALEDPASPASPASTA